MNNFEERLTGGHPNSLGNTIKIVDEVVANGEKFDELFNCYFSEDEVVRLRVSNAMKRVYKERPELVLPYVDRFLNEISKIGQPSTKWTLATLFGWMNGKLTEDQHKSAKDIIKHNLTTEKDWIVLNNSMETLTNWSKSDEELKTWLLPHLERLKSDRRKSVAKRASRFYEHLT